MERVAENSLTTGRLSATISPVHRYMRLPPSHQVKCLPLTSFPSLSGDTTRLPDNRVPESINCLSDNWLAITSRLASTGARPVELPGSRNSRLQKIVNSLWGIRLRLRVMLRAWSKKAVAAECCSSDLIPLLRPVRMVMEPVIMLLFRLWTAPWTDIGSNKFVCKVFCTIFQRNEPDFDSANTADF